MPPFGAIPQPGATGASPTGDQWIRKAQLVVTPSLGNEGLDLSNMHFHFEAEAADKETPNIARIRVYNLLPATVQKVQNEYNGVILSAAAPLAFLCPVRRA